MLKHIVGEHSGQDMAEVEFGRRVLRFTQLSSERQIKESVVIQGERQKHNLLNSRTEYNQCSLPRLCTQVGEGEYKQYGKELEEEKKYVETIQNKRTTQRKNQGKIAPNKRTRSQQEKEENQ